MPSFTCVAHTSQEGRLFQARSISTPNLHVPRLMSGSLVLRVLRHRPVVGRHEASWMLWSSASLVHGFMAYKIWQLHGFFGFSGSTHGFASAYRLKSKSRRCKKNTLDMLRLSLRFRLSHSLAAGKAHHASPSRVCRIQGTGLPAQQQSKKIKNVSWINQKI